MNLRKAQANTSKLYFSG